MVGKYHPITIFYLLILILVVAFFATIALYFTYIITTVKEEYPWAFLIVRVAVLA